MQGSRSCAACSYALVRSCYCTHLLPQDPLSAALHRADSQSTPYNTNHAAAGVASSPSMAAAAPSPFSRSSTAAAAGGNPSAAAPAAGSGGMLDRLRRVGSNSGGSITSSNSGGGIPAAAAAGSTGAQHSRLSKVTGEEVLPFACRAILGRLCSSSCLDTHSCTPVVVSLAVTDCR